MGKRRKRWSWSGEKREICQQTSMPGVSVAQVARRYAMNENMIHTWLKDPRFAPVAEELGDDAMFLPVEIEGNTVHEPVFQEMLAPPPAAPLSANRIDITLSDGRRIVVEGPTALTTVIRSVQGLAV
ncbi:IS66-like element accessory protein TnpA [Sulfitobacter sp. S190]|uniref:IS66-like element accessory protein TnpA n=1 Tax=Sulfitobacter sp. S190 TaxID=2867022 RepID=UPI0021A41757|nr:transposase [Sulfitobacter sp. S190]